MTPVHLERRRSFNPACGEKNPHARVTPSIDLVTCEACRSSNAFAQRFEDRVRFEKWKLRRMAA